MRAETLQIGKLTVLNDCYNANPASMKNALAMLHNLRSCCDANRGRRLVFICGQMAELGPQTKPLHVELGVAAAEAGVDLLVAIGEPPKITAQAARETSRQGLQTLCFDDTLSVCDHVQEFVRARRYNTGQRLKDGPVGTRGRGVASGGVSPMSPIGPIGLIRSNG